MTATHCSRCATPVPLHGSEGLCPRCLLAAASATTRPHRAGMESSPDSEPFIARFQPGDQCGPYRIVRLLGRGATGEVYVAEHTIHHRRLALKILHRRLRKPEDRERALAEGRAAAAVTHPNLVYVFDTGEIAGLFYLALELVTGETLSARVHRLGPLPVPTAVDLVLQVIDGLDAAATAGIVHRDVKPSNCFVTPDGIVKVGDFGLATTTTGNGSTTTNALACTPAFAAPEQLTSGIVDTRTDIYAVGATLFFLLTGKPPYEGTDLAQLIDRVTAGNPQWPAAFKIPAGLEAAITRCLARSPEARFTSFTELRESLAPFSAEAAKPATLTRRATAATLDLLILLPVVGPLVALGVGAGYLHGLLDVALVAAICVGLYAALRQTSAGATFGMRQMGLVVSNADNDRPGWRAASIRALVFVLPFLVMRFASELVPASEFESAIVSLPWTSLLPALAGTSAAALLVARPFTTQSPGALLQDHLSGTRVIARNAPKPPANVETSIAGTRQTPDACAEAATATQHSVAPAAAAEVVGPYHVVRRLSESGGRSLDEARDPQLRRRVWLYHQPGGTPQLSADAKSSTRETRLRWLQGRRSAEEAWDAFDAPAGQPLSTLRPMLWPHVARLLASLTRELATRAREGDSATLSLDRIWSTADGRGLMLDFPAPDHTGANGAETAPAETVDALDESRRGQAFLAQAARVALGSRDIPLPPAAARFLETLAHAGYRDLEEAANALDALQATPDRVTTGQRVNALLLSAASFTVAGLALPALYRAVLGAAPALAAATSATAMVATIAVASAAASACLFAGGIWLAACGMAVVDEGGEPASPLRLAVRAALSWSWLWVLWQAGAAGPRPQLLAIVLGTCAYAATHPAQGLVDRVTRTRLVPR